MGVPALFRWLSKKYPKIVESVKEEEQRYAPRRERTTATAKEDESVKNDEEEAPIPIDMSGPNPNGEEFDALYLDMNGIVHPCTHPEGKPAPETEEEMMLEVFLYTERVVNMVRPRKLLMMAIDGVAPRAKMNQQRSRRFRAAQEARQQDEEMEKALAEWKSRGLEVRGEEGEKKKSWDRNAITPGTPFMDLLASSLRYWVAKKMNQDPGWKNLQVIISDASVPGEGEHKIMDHIRRQRAHPSHDPNTKHVIYGLDADLIMLSLATHEPYFKVLREDVFAQPPGGGSRACNKCGREGHFAANCIGEAAPKPSKTDLIDKSKKQERKPFIFLDVCILREYLEVELAVPGLPFAFDLERAIDDWIFLIFFVGNDFLPHLPSLEIREGAIDELLKIWKRELPKMGGYVTAHGRVELANIQNILSGIAVLEDEIFRKRREAEERQDANQKRRKIEDHARQEADFAREKNEAFKHGETEYVQVPGQRAALPARPDAAAEAALAENRTKAIAALESGDTTQVIDNARAIRLANLGAAERLKAELVGSKAQAAAKAASLSNKAKAKAMRNGTAVVEEAKIVELGEEAAVSSDTESFATAADSDAPTAALAAADDSAVFKMDEDEPVDGGAESAPARARKRTIDEVEGEVTPEGDEKVTEGVEEAVVKLTGDEDEADPVVATNFERVVNADGTVSYEDTVKLWEPGYRARYYQQKFGVGLEDTEFRRQVVKSYVEGLAWVLMYYYQGCPSWTWYYPYHFSPFAADFVELDTLNISFDLGKPFRPYDQLMGVLPADSRASIPPVFHSLMLDEDSEIIDFYPTDFAIDMNGKKMEWQGVALLPFIDEKRLLDAIETRYSQLSEDELRRNAFGDHMLFVADAHPLYEPLCKLYAKRKGDKPVELDPTLSGGITGTVKPDPACVPGSTFNSPLTQVGQPDLHNDQSISTLYEFPEQTTPHRSVLLKGVRPPKRVLTSDDKEWTRMGAPDRGRGRGRGRGGPSRGGSGRTEFGDVRMGAGPVANMSYQGYGGGTGSYGAGGGGYNSPYGGSYASSYGGSGYNTPSNGYGGSANAAWSAAPAAQQAYGAPHAGAYGGYAQPAAQGYGGYGGTGSAYGGTGGAYGDTGAAYGGATAAYGGTGAAYGAAQTYGGSGGSYGAAPGFGGGAYGGGGYQQPAQSGSYGSGSAYGGGPPPGAYGGYGGYGSSAPQSHSYHQPQQAPPRPSGPPPPLGFRGGAPRGGSSGSKRGGRGGSGGPWGQY